MTARPVFFVLALWMVWVLQLGGSCASDVSYSERHEAEYVPPPPPRETIVREYREYPDGPPPGRVYVEPPPPGRVYVEPPPPERVYVEPDRGPRGGYVDRGDRDLPPRIPRGSYRVEDKEGKIRWTAEDDGTFYLYDVSKEFVRYSGPVRRGQEVIIQPGDDIVYVDGRQVSHENLRHEARHQVYFAPGRNNGARVEEDRGHGEKTGGAGDPGRTIPKGTTRVASGRGDLVINAASKNGKVFVYDEDVRNVITTADIDRGNSFKLDVSSGVVYVNSKKFATVKVPRGHTLSLYFGG